MKRPLLAAFILGWGLRHEPLLSRVPFLACRVPVLIAAQLPACVFHEATGTLRCRRGVGALTWRQPGIPLQQLCLGLAAATFTAIVSVCGLLALIAILEVLLLILADASGSAVPSCFAGAALLTGPGAAVRWRARGHRKQTAEVKPAAVTDAASHYSPSTNPSTPPQGPARHSSWHVRNLATQPPGKKRLNALLSPFLEHADQAGARVTLHTHQEHVVQILHRHDFHVITRTSWLGHPRFLLLRHPRRTRDGGDP